MSAQESGSDDSRPSGRGLPVSSDIHQMAIRQALPIYYGLLFALLTAGAILLLWWLKDVLLLLFISVLFAAAVSRPSAYLERIGIPRGFAAIAVYLASFAILVAVGWFVVPTAVSQVATLADNAPAYADRYDNLRASYDKLAEKYPTLGTFDEQVGSIQERIINSVAARLLDLPMRLFSIFLDTLAVFVISMLVVTSRERLLAFILAMVHPDHRETTQDVLVKMWQRLGHYLRAKLIVMAIVGAITYVVLLLIGVPYPLMLAIIVAFGELIPRVGPWIARIPLLAIALLDGWVTFGLTFAASIIIENLKGMVISPFVEGDQLDIPPLLVFVAVLVGAALLGPAGAFVAVPAAAMVQVVFEEVIIPWRRRQLAPAEEALATNAGPVKTDDM
ncbi:MAG TPA: AI-2E family transporter [Thermomicrobiales bacterium]|nr:AI-2E family transporter [Thermomicrobiales bacterium]